MSHALIHVGFTYDAHAFVASWARTYDFVWGMEHGRRAPLRRINERSRRAERNARGHVRGADRAARPMHEAYRARRRRRSGRR